MSYRFAESVAHRSDSVSSARVKLTSHVQAAVPRGSLDTTDKQTTVLWCRIETTPVMERHLQPAGFDRPDIIGTVPTPARSWNGRVNVHHRPRLTGRLELKTEELVRDQI